MLFVLAAVLITACGQSAGNVALKPGATATASAQPSAESTPQPSPSPATFDLTCRLPVTGDSESARNRGWITFPGGQFTPDPSKQSNGSYDWAINAWVPVEQNYVASDGATYVFERAGPVADTIYLVSAKTGNRRVILSTQGPAPRTYWAGVTQYSSGHAYLLTVGGSSDAPSNLPGLWVLDALTGRLHVIGSTHLWELVGRGFAWALEDDSYNGGGMTVFRLDLTTGHSISWYHSKAYLTLLSPTPDGELLVGYGQNGRLALLDESRALTLLDWPQGYDGSDPVWSLAQPGTWLTETTSANLDLYVKAGGVRRMVGSPYLGPLYPAGDCR